jgi:hypothetical protein
LRGEAGAFLGGAPFRITNALAYYGDAWVGGWQSCKEFLSNITLSFLKVDNFTSINEMFPCSQRASLLQIAGKCSPVFIGLSPGGNAFISDIGKNNV